MFTGEEIAAFFTVIGIDLVLSGDNAIVIGAAAAGLPIHQRHRAITLGIIVAAVTRMGFALIAFFLLKIVGLTLAGGLLLLWVAWTMWRQIRNESRLYRARQARIAAGEDESETQPPVKSFRSALTAIVVADVSMSLDNILAVTGAAHEHFMILVFGLALSIALMGVAANFIAGLMNRYRWIVYVGLVLITYVALDMIWRGANQVADYVALTGGSI